MMFQWNEKTIGWLQDAADYTGFYKNLAAALLPRIAVRGSLCDMGCGMALTDFALAGEIGEITCVDVDGTVLDYVNRTARGRGITNVKTLQSDGPAAPGHWDTVIALFHGVVDEVCVPYLEKAEDRLILVTHGQATGMTHKCVNAGDTAAWLDAHGFVYEKTLGALEFGQPFRCWEELPRWASAFMNGAAGEAYRIRTAATLRTTGRADFPFYAPKTREYGIFVIPKTDNLSNIKNIL